MTDQPITTRTAIDPAIEHVFTAWDDALGAKDLDAAMALYHPDATLESPLVAYLLGVEEGIVRGRDALRSFVAQVFEHQPAERRRFRTGFLTDGQHMTWEYPRQSPDGDQMDIVEVMENHRRPDRPPPRLLGLEELRHAYPRRTRPIAAHSDPTNATPCSRSASPRPSREPIRLRHRPEASEPPRATGLLSDRHLRQESRFGS